LPAELQRREEWLQRIREAKRALEARARQEAEAAAKEPDGEGSKKKAKPEEKVSTTSPIRSYSAQR
jgi:hypothetical protein